ncbi:MAG: tRNA (adenosine(37)-N6)-threonylcarbamoyltransferase complex ATPase subunit type 1 TsaE [Parcubacteria group bacterium]|nr:tRNA (adenosine(37)-N6)-threonylcarbamoyltransferase complex ATPase subunit type 1 TsaE [Parcubacteria group bacterium]
MMHSTKNEQETQVIAEEFTKTLKGGEVVYLHGDLGAGKTTFVRAVARALGFTEPVRSPTFTIVNRYEVTHSIIRQIIHVDLYRIEDPSELIPLALEEELGRPGVVTFIEWPERAHGNLAEASTTINMKILGDEHQIEII